MQDLAKKIKQWGQALGFQQIGITDTNLNSYEPRFIAWLENQFHGEMHYMEKQVEKRLQPNLLIPDTLRIITARMDYLPADTSMIESLNNPERAYLSRYALGRDYHRLIRKRLQALALKINDETEHHGYRTFCDSAPVLEKPLAEKSG